MKRKRLAIAVAQVAVLLLCASSIFAADWPYWRGPNRTGALQDTGAFDAESIGLELAWTTAIGAGYSGIAVAGGRAVTMFSDSESDFLIALDTTSGKEIWRYRIGDTYKGHDGSTDGPLAMPTIDGKRVYAFGPFGQLMAVNLSDGKELWRVETPDVVGARPPTYGFTTSPVVFGDILFVETGGDDGRCHTGFDKKTGEVRWTVGEDTVGYQSPTPATLAGTDQILAVSNKMVAGLVPDGGEILWSYEYNDQGGDGSSTPVVLGDDRFLLSGRQDSALYAVRKTDDGFEVDEVWRTKAIKGSFAVPVLYEGHLYGFDGNFLTCVDAETGEKVWKSRPPGGLGLILVDGNLVIYGAEGDVVVARASPDGYDERARLNVSKSTAHTWPSFADGRIYVRDLKQISSVSVGEVMLASRRTEPMTAPRNRFEEFVRHVESAPGNKAAMIDDFMSAQSAFPIVEGDRWVHFVYRGDVEDIAVSGSMYEFRVEEPMDRVAGTDLYYKSVELEPGSRVEYQFNIDFDNTGPDPANPLRVRARGADASVVGLPGWTRPDFVKAYRGSSPGRLDTFKHESAILENEREVSVYLPPGYDDSDRSYPLVIANRGEEWIDFANLPNELDNLIGSKVAPVIVAFVRSTQASGPEYGGPKTDDYVKMLADELVPYIDEHYRTIATPESRAVMGAVRLGMISAYTALSRPDVFGLSAVHTMYLPSGIGDKVVELIEAGKGKSVRFHVDWNRYELVLGSADLDLAKDSERMWDLLKSNGFDVAGGKAIDGYGWGSWQVRAAEMLQEFFPM